MNTLKLTVINTDLLLFAARTGEKVTAEILRELITAGYFAGSGLFKV